MLCLYRNLVIVIGKHDGFTVIAIRINVIFLISPLSGVCRQLMITYVSFALFVDNTEPVCTHDIAKQHRRPVLRSVLLVRELTATVSACDLLTLAIYVRSLLCSSFFFNVWSETDPRVGT